MLLYVYGLGYCNKQHILPTNQELRTNLMHFEWHQLRALYSPNMILVAKKVKQKNNETDIISQH